MSNFLFCPYSGLRGLSLSDRKVFEQLSELNAWISCVIRMAFRFQRVKITFTFSFVASEPKRPRNNYTLGQVVLTRFSTFSLFSRSLVYILDCKLPAINILYCLSLPPTSLDASAFWYSLVTRARSQLSRKRKKTQASSQQLSTANKRKQTKKRSIAIVTLRLMCFKNIWNNAILNGANNGSL